MSIARVMRTEKDNKKTKLEKVAIIAALPLEAACPAGRSLL